MHIRFFPSLLFTVSAICLATLSIAKAGGIGSCEPICPPFISICKGGPHAGLQCTEDEQCPKSECIASTFTSPPSWPRVCKGGETDGHACVAISAADDPCGRGFCVMDFVPTKPANLKGDLTIIMDDNETTPDGVDSCGAAAILLELREMGKPRFLSQLYRCLPADLETDVEFLRTEDELNASADEAEDPQASNTVSILTRLLFRPSENDTNLLAPEELRTALLELVGNPQEATPIIVNAKKTTKALEHENHGGTDDHLASVVRFEVQIRFVRIPSP